MEDQLFYLKYDISNKDRHDRLVLLFEKLKVEKEQYYKTSIEPDTKLISPDIYLDKKAKEWFNIIVIEHGSEEQKIYDQLWKLTSPEIRINHPMFNTGDSWNFESMLEVIFEGDYELVRIEAKENKGTLFYHPGGAPFGGTEALVQLIESFGNKVTDDYWHGGPHNRLKIGWDYELAKKLVQEGKGIETINQKVPIPQIAKKQWWEFWK